MTALSLPRLRRPPAPHPPVGILAASLALVAVGQLASVNRGRRRQRRRPSPPASRRRHGRPHGRRTRQPPNAPFADAPASLAQIDQLHRRAGRRTWRPTTSTSSPPRNVALLYEAPGTHQRRCHRLRPGRGGREPVARRSSRASSTSRRSTLGSCSRPTSSRGRSPRRPRWTGPRRTSRPSWRSSATRASSSATSTARPRSTPASTRSRPAPAVTARLARVAFLRGDAGGRGRARRSRAQGRGRGPGRRRPGAQLVRLPRRHAVDVGGHAGRRCDVVRPRRSTAWPEQLPRARRTRARRRGPRRHRRRDRRLPRRRSPSRPQPDALTALGDLLALARRRRGGGASSTPRSEAIARLQGDGGLVYNRQLVLFDVNHAGDVAEALDPGRGRAGRAQGRLRLRRATPGRCSRTAAPPTRTPR